MAKECDQTKTSPNWEELAVSLGESLRVFAVGGAHWEEHQSEILTEIEAFHGFVLILGVNSTARAQELQEQAPGAKLVGFAEHNQLYENAIYTCYSRDPLLQYAPIKEWVANDVPYTSFVACNVTSDNATFCYQPGGEWSTRKPPVEVTECGINVDCRSHVAVLNPNAPAFYAGVDEQLKLWEESKTEGTLSTCCTDCTALAAKCLSKYGLQQPEQCVIFDTVKLEEKLKLYVGEPTTGEAIIFTMGDGRAVSEADDERPMPLARMCNWDTKWDPEDDNNSTGKHSTGALVAPIVGASVAPGQSEATQTTQPRHRLSSNRTTHRVKAAADGRQDTWTFTPPDGLLLKVTYYSYNEEMKRCKVVPTVHVNGHAQLVNFNVDTVTIKADRLGYPVMKLQGTATEVDQNVQQHEIEQQLLPEPLHASWYLHGSENQEMVVQPLDRKSVV